MDAFRGLLRLYLIDHVFGFISLIRDGKDAQRGDRLVWIVRRSMHHSYANGNVVSDIDKHDSQNDSDEDSCSESSKRRQERDSPGSKAWGQ